MPRKPFKYVILLVFVIVIAAGLFTLRDIFSPRTPDNVENFSGHPPYSLKEKKTPKPEDDDVLSKDKNVKQVQKAIATDKPTKENIVSEKIKNENAADIKPDNPVKNLSGIRENELTAADEKNTVSDSLIYLEPSNDSSYRGLLSDFQDTPDQDNFISLRPLANVVTTGINDAISLAFVPLKWDKQDFLILNSVLLSTVLLSRFDEPLRSQVVSAKRNDKVFLMQFGERYGRNITSEMAALAFGLYGAALDDDEMLTIGLEIFESYFITNNIVSVLKRSFGRARPYEEKGSNYFEPFPNRENNSENAFPSAHTALAFSLSSVLAAHTDNIYLKALCFTPAVLTGISRVYHDRHWVSDVFLGGAVGYLIGTYLVSRHDKDRAPDVFLSLDPEGRLSFSLKL